MLKGGAATFARTLAKHFNNILLSGKFPTSWRLSILAVMHKREINAIPKIIEILRYLYISLCKIFCLILHNRLSLFIDKK